MDIARFDRLTRTFSLLLSRRAIARVLGLGVIGCPMLTEAKKGHKHKNKRKIRRNEFGCVSFDNYCTKNDQCCSGICKGKCQDHDRGSCSGSPTISIGGPLGPCTSSAGEAGTCIATTGRAHYCFVTTACFACTTDADCISVCGPHAACIQYPFGPSGCHTGCAGPSTGSCTFGP